MTHKLNDHYQQREVIRHCEEEREWGWSVLVLQVVVSREVVGGIFTIYFYRHPSVCDIIFISVIMNDVTLKCI